MLLLIACVSGDETGAPAPVTCDEGAALLADVCAAEDVEIDVDSTTADCESRPQAWQSCWLDCISLSQDQNCDPAMLDCSADCEEE
jgi:hypothetical protein